MSHKVRFDARAQAELYDILQSIAERTGSVSVAEAYVRRIVDHCLALETFPERGTSHAHLRPGLRTMGLERRATIAFLVTDEEVTILRVFYGGRDMRDFLTPPG